LAKTPVKTLDKIFMLCKPLFIWLAEHRKRLLLKSA